MIDPTVQRKHAQSFRALHARGEVLVLVNAWDAASARVLESAGSKAVATTSAGVAWSLGYADGQRLAIDELVGACARICRVVGVPVSVDVERGFGDTADEVCALVDRLIDAGAVGVNIEDGVAAAARTLVDPGVLAAKIEGLRKLAKARGVDLFVNARTDVYFMPCDDSVARFEDALARARAYAAAGADGIFVPGIEDLGEMSKLAAAVDLPLNVYAGYEGLPPVAALREAGVRRVSLGCGPFQAALALLRGIAAEALHEGTYRSMTQRMIASREMNELLTRA